jgi:deoxyadenosine/deoxycytidine kinase
MKIVIDGLIGAGKSTQIELLSKHMKLDVYKEPIEEWPLESFYEDPSRWGFMMQMAVLNSYTNARFYDGIFERCPESSKNVFWKNLVDTNTVTQQEDEIFQRCFETYTWEPDVLIFIDKSPKLCYKHIQKRKQDGDAGVTVEYLEKLHAYYQDFIKNNTKNTHVIDGTQSISAVSKDIIKIIKPILANNKCSALI